VNTSIAGTRRGVAAVIVVLAAYAASVTTLAIVFPETPGAEQPPVGNAAWGIAYLVLGSIVLWHHPRHVMARVMLAFGLLALTTALTQIVDLRLPTGLQDRVAWVGVSLFIGYGACTALLIHLFPTGRPPSPLWRWPIRLLWFGTAGLILGTALGLDPSDGPAAKAGALVATSCYGIGLLSSIPSLGYRFWRSRDAERAQVKWFLLAVIVAVVGWMTDTVVGSVSALVLPPLAITVALLRYRLYDIDRLISRTASYAIVTALVVATYAVVAAGITSLLPETSSNLAVAAATLTAAALARPLLQRVQRAVDRRFDRNRYDQVETVNAFGERVRHLVDADDVGDDLLSTITGSLQPAHAALRLGRTS
jgi:hypothetical protein